MITFTDIRQAAMSLGFDYTECAEIQHGLRTIVCHARNIAEFYVDRTTGREQLLRTSNLGNAYHPSCVDGAGNQIRARSAMLLGMIEIHAKELKAGYYQEIK